MFGETVVSVLCLYVSAPKETLPLFTFIPQKSVYVFGRLIDKFKGFFLFYSLLVKPYFPCLY